MKFIAHRVFRDGEPLDAFDALRVAGCDGAEIDVRHDGAGQAIVQHSPLFAARRRRRGEDRSLSEAVRVLGEAAPALRTLFLDVKTRPAAEAAARMALRERPPFELVFACWHHDEVAAVRAVLPRATVFYVVAPVFASRAPRGGFGDLYLSNSFPYLVRSTRFRPRLDKVDRHDINLKLISSRTLAARLPDGIDGVCVHRIFQSGPLAAFAEGRSLGLAVYGLRPAREAGALAGLRVASADYAIISRAPGVFRPTEATHSRDRAA
jgi:hypothetical protein